MILIAFSAIFLNESCNDVCCVEANVEKFSNRNLGISRRSEQICINIPAASALCSFDLKCIQCALLGVNSTLD